MGRDVQINRSVPPLCLERTGNKDIRMSGVRVGRGISLQYNGLQMTDLSVLSAQKLCVHGSFLHPRTSTTRNGDHSVPAPVSDQGQGIAV